MLDGMGDAGRDGQTVNGLAGNDNIPETAIFADPDRGRARDNKNFGAPPVVMVTANGPWLADDHMKVLLTGQRRNRQRIKNGAPVIGRYGHFFNGNGFGDLIQGRIL